MVSYFYFYNRFHSATFPGPPCSTKVEFHGKILQYVTNYIESRGYQINTINVFVLTGIFLRRNCVVRKSSLGRKMQVWNVHLDRSIALSTKKLGHIPSEKKQGCSQMQMPILFLQTKMQKYDFVQLKKKVNLKHTNLPFLRCKSLFVPSFWVI